MPRWRRIRGIGFHATISRLRRYLIAAGLVKIQGGGADLIVLRGRRSVIARNDLENEARTRPRGSRAALGMGTDALPFNSAVNIFPSNRGSLLDNSGGVELNQVCAG